VTTVEIESLANVDGLATQDLLARLPQILRRLVVPEFLRDIDRHIGRVHWRRKTTTINVVSPTRNYDCPADFDKFERLQRRLTTGTGLGPELDYIGEESDLVLAAEAATVAAAPGAYYIVAGATNQWAIRLSAPPDGSYTLLGVYTKGLAWTNDTTPVNLDPLIPYQYQGGLVKRLRMYILEDRVGVRDNRYSIAASEYERWIEGLEFSKEPAQRHRMVVVN